MSWNINYSEELGIIEITYTGDVTGFDLLEATAARISMQKETGATLVLADASQSLDGPPTMDLYNLPDRIYPDHESRRDTRIAFILPKHKNSRELATFFQTAARNRGWIIELFEDRKSALSWLESK